MLALLEKLLPVLFLLLIGWILRKRNIVSHDTVGELKNIIVNVALPCILFLSFAKTTFEAKHALVVLLVFAMCGVLYGAGYLLSMNLPRFFRSIFLPWFMAGFEFGMIGIGLFGALFGTEHLSVFMLVGLGHEFFAWFVCIPYVQFKNSGTFRLSETIAKFFKTPVILGIFAGLIVNVTGTYPLIGAGFFGRAVVSAMGLLSNVAVPLILMVIGYSLVIERGNLQKIMLHMIARLALVLAIGTATLWLIGQLVGAIDPIFTVAFYAFLILPPSYLLPVLVANNQEEKHFYSQAVVYYTLVSFIGYIILLLFL